MIPLPPDPTAAALQALTCGETPELRAAAPMLLHKALARWPAHPELIDALVTLCEELPETALLEARALVPLLDAQATRWAAVDNRTGKGTWGKLKGKGRRRKWRRPKGRWPPRHRRPKVPVMRRTGPHACGAL